jgi:hypothetical protein
MFAPFIDVADTGATTTYTFLVDSQGCDASVNPCCNMDLRKVEFHMNDVCSSSVTNASVAIPQAGGSYLTVPKTIQFTSYGTGRTVG